MAKRYINTRASFNQENADNWLLMIPCETVSSDSKIVYLALKKMQWHDGSCSTDAHTWFKITGLKFDRVKECLVELEAFGLVELYMSPKELRDQKSSFKVYLLDHFLMKKGYPIVDCPHDGVSVPNPLDESNWVRIKRTTSRIQEFRESIEGAKADGNSQVDK